MGSRHVDCFEMLLAVLSGSIYAFSTVLCREFSRSLNHNATN